MAKFIPIGTMDSFYDDNSKLKRIPKSLVNNMKSIKKKGNDSNEEPNTMMDTKMKGKKDIKLVKKSIEFTVRIFIIYLF